jgi:HD-GYP domain-containing protein (c-di-GMP phosphodiesterase class II)
MNKKILEGGSYMRNTESLIKKLCVIGVELSARKDVDALLELILKESMEIVGCDAGSIYITHGEGEAKKLEFRYTRNHSLEFPFKRFFMPIDLNSIAGACAKTGKIYNFNHMHETVETLGFKHNTSYDESIGYHTVNMLVIPLKNYEGDITGVLQLINKKQSDCHLKLDEDYRCIIPFETEDEQIISALASQAAILIERTHLFEAIQALLDSVIRALVTALDQRDPITAGHSERVANYAKDLLLRLGGDHISKDQIRELYIAGLLHDVGKIGVPEYLLMKSHKIPIAHMRAIESRFKYIDLILQTKEALKTCSNGEREIKEKLDEWVVLLKKVNASGFLPDEEEALIHQMATIEIVDLRGDAIRLLEEEEIKPLLIKRGNLTDVEREKINSHVKKSYEVLSDILWTKDLLKVPTIASLHHEKLNGRGYPYGLASEQLSLEARIMSIVDIYDALTATDRPYKPAVPIKKSLEILVEEANFGALDSTLVATFKEMIEEREGL